MDNLGLSELLIVIPLALLSLAFPVFVITMQIMIYRKVNRIERRLDAQS